MARHASGTWPAASRRSLRSGTAAWSATCHSAPTAGATLKHALWVFLATYSPDGKWSLTASHDGTARVWDAQTGRSLSANPMRHDVAVRHAAFSPDGARVATAGWDGAARVWDSATG